MKFLFIIIYIFQVICVCVLNKKKFKKIIKINLIYTVLWVINVITSIINPLELTQPDDWLYILLYISLTLINIIYFVHSPKNKIIQKIDIKDKDFYNYKLIYILNIIAFFAILPNLLQTIRLLSVNGLNLSMIRTNVYLGIGSSGNDFIILLTRTLPMSIYTVTALFCAINISRNEKKLLFTAICGILIYSLTFGGRLILLIFAIYYIASLIVQNIDLKFKNLRKINYVFIIIIIITALRISSMVGLIRQTELYLFSSLSYLSQMLNNPSGFGLDKPLYGYVTFSVLIEPIVLVGKLILKWKIKVPTYYLNTYTQKFINIGINEKIMFNNNCSFLYSFMLDWGKIGIIIGPIIIVLIELYLEKKTYKNFTPLRYNLLIYIYGVLLLSIMFYKLNGISSSIAIILIFLCCKKTEKSHKNVTK